jgi:hypothetical protein
MSLEELLIQAENEKYSGDKDQQYASFKRSIQRLNLSPIEYQNAINQLCEILEY